MSTLADLKRAIERVEEYRRAPLLEALNHAVGWTAAERDAWRVAFEWLFRVPLGSDDYDEGMRLIREKLK